MRGKSIWVNPKGAYVATYGVCSDCLDRFYRVSDSVREGMAQLAEDRLLKRYPFLLDRLEPEEDPACR
jgi:hypothetical protein